jgi:hypothetical protein
MMQNRGYKKLSLLFFNQPSPIQADLAFTISCLRVKIAREILPSKVPLASLQVFS